MPTYTFKNKITSEILEKEMKISEREDFLHENPDLIQILTSTPPTLDPVRLGVTKSPDSFKDLMKNIKNKSGRASTIKI